MAESEEGSRMTDHINLYNKALTIIKRKGYELFLWPVPDEMPITGTFIANRGNRDFFAEDPLRLLGMIAIWEEHGDGWYDSPKFPSEKIRTQLMEEAYPDSPADYDGFDDERFARFAEKCRYFFGKDYMPDVEIREGITREELFRIIVDLKREED